MNIVNYLLYIFFKEELVNTCILIILSFITNIFQTNIISYVTANIIEFIQKNNSNKVNQYFKYFIVISVIYIDDYDIQEIDSDYIRTNIVYVNQNSKLFDRKVIENILYGCYDLDTCNGYLKEIMKYPKINQLFKNVDIHNKKVGLFGENLSGGQRQVVNIIGGLIMPSKIVILDEPTNALDIELKEEIIQLIADFRKHKKCIIIISHDKETFHLFDETLNINN